MPIPQNLLNQRVPAQALQQAQTKQRSTMHTPDNWLAPACAGAPIHHFDLYRLSRPLDLQRVGWADSVRSAVCLVEWPDRLGEQCPPEHLALTICILEQVPPRMLSLSNRCPGLLA